MGRSLNYPGDGRRAEQRPFRRKWVSEPPRVVPSTRCPAGERWLRCCYGTRRPGADPVGAAAAGHRAHPPGTGQAGPGWGRREAVVKA